jgi:hypothetical protein
MISEILDKRYIKVTRLLNYMIRENNQYKVRQAYYIICQINERKQELFNQKQNYINSIR